MIPEKKFVRWKRFSLRLQNNILLWVVLLVKKLVFFFWDNIVISSLLSCIIIVEENSQDLWGFFWDGKVISFADLYCCWRNLLSFKKLFLRPECDAFLLFEWSLKSTCLDLRSLQSFSSLLCIFRRIYRFPSLICTVFEKNCGNKYEGCLSEAAQLFLLSATLLKRYLKISFPGQIWRNKSVSGKGTFDELP